MLKRIKKENIIYLFFIIQPLISIYRNIWGDNLKLFGFSFFEMINIFFVIGLWFFAFYLTKSRRVLYIIPYFVVLGIYCVIHYYNIAQFNTDIIDREIYGFVQESYYIFRVYGIPVLLLFSLFFLKLKKEFYIKTLCDIAFLIGAIVVLSNFMGISLCTYSSEGHTHLVHGSFFSWFMLDGTEEIQRFTSSGLFASGNEISGLLLVTLPVVILRFLKKMNVRNTLGLVVTMLAMLMIGTRTATIGSGAIFFLVMAVCLIVHISKRNYSYIKKWLPVFMVGLVLWCGLFYYSPYFQGEFPHYSTAQNRDEEENEEEDEERVLKSVNLSSDTEEEREQAVDYIHANYWNHFINSQFIKLYPVEGDLDFWISIINREPGINQNYRAFKQEIMHRVFERNGRALDKFVGIGMMHELDCEKDYVNQFYQFGSVGLILIMGIYIMILFKNCFLFIRHIKCFWEKEYVIYMCAFGISILLPYITGHMIGIPMTMFQMVLLILLVESKREEIEKRERKNIIQ